VCDAAAPSRVVGYYAISTAMERRAVLLSARLRRGMPERVPLLLIGRLAIDHDFQGMGLGTELLADALRRCLAASQIAGTRAIVAHAIDDDTSAFIRGTILCSRLLANASCCCRSKRLGLCLKTNHCVCLGQLDVRLDR
jgi:GNAT superfamily N-acetyltransferase